MKCHVKYCVNGMMSGEINFIFWSEFFIFQIPENISRTLNTFCRHHHQRSQTLSWDLRPWSCNYCNPCTTILFWMGLSESSWIVICFILFYRSNNILFAFLPYFDFDQRYSFPGEANLFSCPSGRYDSFYRWIRENWKGCSGLDKGWSLGIWSDDSTRISTIGWTLCCVFGIYLVS